MPSYRLARLNELIREEFNKILLKEIEFPANYLVTIERVETKADLGNSIIYISVLPIKYRPDALHLLERRQPHFQSLLFKRLNLKFVPKISFKIDTSEEKADRIYRILDRPDKER